MVAMLDYGFGEPAAAKAGSAASGIAGELCGLVEGPGIVRCRSDDDNRKGLDKYLALVEMNIRSATKSS
jgi:hypothetical protein